MRDRKGTGKVSLRSWQYCLGARLTFWRRSCDQKREWGRRVWISISRLTPLETASPPNLTWLLQNTASYAGYWQVDFQIWCLSEAVVSTKHFPKLTRGASHKSVFADVPENGLQSLKNNFTEIRPILFSLDHLLSHDYLAGLWTCNWLKIDYSGTTSLARVQRSRWIAYVTSPEWAKQQRRMCITLFCVHFFPFLYD